MDAIETAAFAFVRSLQMASIPKQGRMRSPPGSASSYRGRAVAFNPSVLILDEVTASIGLGGGTPTEIDGQSFFRQDIHFHRAPVVHDQAGKLHLCVNAEELWKK